MADIDEHKKEIKKMLKAANEKFLPMWYVNVWLPG